MERINMSLDDIMTQKSKESRSKSQKHVKKVNKAAKPEQKIRGNTGGVSFLRDNREERSPRGGRQQQQQGSGMIVRTIKPLNSRQPQMKSTISQVSDRGNGGGNSNSSIMNRVGGGSASSGTKVLFSNLVNSVESSDLTELCSTVGEVTELSLKMFPASGMKSAEVVFSRQSDARKCIDKFNGVTLDGVIMEVSMAIAEPKSIFDRVGGGASAPASAAFRATSSAGYMQPGSNSNANAKTGLFGSALDNNNNYNNNSNNNTNSYNMGHNGGSTSFKVTMNAAPPGGGNAATSQRNGRSVINEDDRSNGVCYAYSSAEGCRFGADCRFDHPSGGNGRKRGGGNDSRGGDRGRGEDRRGGGGDRAPKSRGNDRSGGRPATAKKAMSAEDLDKEMDSYHGKTSDAPAFGNGGGGGKGGGRGGKGGGRGAKAAPASGEELDADMDSYFANK